MTNLFVFILTFYVLDLYSQVIVNENFDNYIAGQKLVQQAGGPWTTWSNAPGSNEDPIVSSNLYFSSYNSVYIQNDNDLVLNLYDKTSGRYLINFKINIMQNKLGYFNLLNNFAGNSSVWAFQAYFKNNGYLVIDAGGASVDSITYSTNTWNDINIVVDLDEDIASIEVNGSFFYAWKFSSGTFGTGNLKKLDGLNFYGWYEGGVNSGYYVDNVLVEQKSNAPPSPSNLEVTLLPTNIDVLLTWNPPSQPVNNYVIIRDKKIIAVISGTETSYIDPMVYPGNHEYKLYAYYINEGLSYGLSGNITVPGGIERDLVLFEIATATWCSYCPSAALGEQQLVSNNDPVAIINYHVSDNFSNNDGNIRINYYNVEGTPTSIADGIIKIEGGSSSGSLYDYYKNMYEQRLPIPSTHELHLDITQQSQNQYIANVKVIQHSNYFSSGLRLYCALVENDINFNWQNQTKLHHVLRKMFPNANGTILNFSENDTLFFTFEFSTSNYVADNCEFITFIQHYPTKEVIQTKKISLSNLTSNKSFTQDVKIFPTLIKNYLIVKNAQGKNLLIFNSLGKILKIQKINDNYTSINLSNLDNGIYFIKFENETSIYKIIKY